MVPALGSQRAGAQLDRACHDQQDLIVWCNIEGAFCGGPGARNNAIL